MSLDGAVLSANASATNAGSSELALLQAVVHAATQFLRTSEVAASLDELLCRIGTATGASRVYVFENDPVVPGESITATQCAEWTAPGVTAYIGTPVVTHVALDSDGFEHWFNAFSQGHPFVTVVDDLPPLARDRLHAAGVLSMAAAPIFVDDEFYGFIGVDNCESARLWSVIEVEALSAAAVVVGAAIRRRRKDEALRNATTKAQLAADIGEVVTGAGNSLHEMLERCRAAIMNRLRPDFVRIWMLSENLDCLLACTAAGLTPAQHAGEGLPAISPSLITVASEERPTHWNDGVPELWPGATEEFAQTGIAAGVGFPLITNGRVNGVMVVLGREFPSANIVDSAESVTDEISLAIERHHSHGAMTRAETRYRRLVEATVEGIVIHDYNKVVDTNPSFTNMLGYTYDEVIGRNPLSFIPEEYHVFVRELLAVKYDQPYEVEAIRKDGSRFPVEIKGTDFEGERNMRVTAIRDITDRRKMQDTSQKLRDEQQAREYAEKTRERAEFLANASRVLASSLDMTTTLTQLAHLATPMIADYCVVSVLNDGVPLRVAVVHSDPEKEQLLREAVATWPIKFPDSHPMSAALLGGQTFVVREMDDSMIAKITVSDDHERMVRALAPRSQMAVPIKAGGVVLGSILFASTQAERRYGPEDVALAEEFAYRAGLALQTARSYHEALAASRARDEMLAVVAHDLRNPLNTIFMGSEFSLEMLATKAAAGADNRLEVKQMEIIRRSAEHMNRLIQDLLDASRIDSGNLSLEKATLNAVDLLREACEMFGPLASHAKIALDVDTNVQIPAFEADKTRLLQVLSNLVGNALKFTPKGGRIVVSAAAKSDVGTKVSFARFTVADTGPGIPEDQLPHIFGRGWQARRGDRRGIGVGLAIASGIVEAHGGMIWVDSKLGEGSNFHFTVPL